MGMGFAPTWFREVSPLLHMTTLTTALRPYPLKTNKRHCNTAFSAFAHCCSAAVSGSVTQCRVLGPPTTRSRDCHSVTKTVTKACAARLRVLGGPKIRHWLMRLLPAKQLRNSTEGSVAMSFICFFMGCDIECGEELYLGRNWRRKWCNFMVWHLINCRAVDLCCWSCPATFSRCKQTAGPTVLDRVPSGLAARLPAMTRRLTCVTLL